MRKTTVYLPDGLKAELAKVASASGRSEADLIRAGIGAVVAGHLTTPTRRLPLFASGLPDLAERADEDLDGFGDR